MTLGERNLARAGELALERLGDYDSVWFEGRWYRNAEQAERGNRIGAALVDLGIEPGDRVAVMMENSPDVTVVYQAVWRAGAAITPVIFLLGVEDLRRILVDSGAAAIITSSGLLEKVTEAARGVETLRHVIADLDVLAEHSRGEIVPRADDDLALLLYTGGTTGRAKGVMLTHSNLWHAGWAGHQLRKESQDDVTRGISCLPLSHAFGVLGVAGGLHRDTQLSSVLMRWFEPVAWLQLASEHKVQFGAMVPSMIYMLLQQPLEDYDLSSLEIIGSGAAPLTAAARLELERRLPQVRIGEGYGLTECAGSATSMRREDLRPGTVGQPVPGCEIRTFDEEDRELPTGDVGEIVIRSGSVMKGYWNDPEETAKTMRNGWLHTGDMGRVDSEGFVTIVERKKDVIIRGGFNVYPRDVEEALAEHPAISGAGVVGRPDDIHGEEVVAFVTLRPEAEAAPEEIVAWARERLGGYKYPREVHLLDALPLSPVGKLDRKALRAQVPVTTP